MNFCRECNNMLYPKEDKTNKKLLLACRNCGHQEPAQNCCIHRNTNQREDDKTQVYHEIAQDPTLPRTRLMKCGRCGHPEAVYFQAKQGVSAQATRSTDEAMTLFFVCTHCSYRWKD